MTWDPFNAQWERGFALLSEYHARAKASCDLPKHEEQGEKLGVWLGTQRVAWKKGALDGRRRRLEEVGVTWDPFDARNGSGTLRCCRNTAREGDCDVPQRHEEQKQKLGEWLGTQRKAWKGTLDDAPGQLEEVGVSGIRSTRSGSEALRCCPNTARARGHCDVPQQARGAGRGARVVAADAAGGVEEGALDGLTSGGSRSWA